MKCKGHTEFAHAAKRARNLIAQSRRKEMTEFVYEFARLLALYRQAEQSAPELARAAVVWLSGQWAFLLLACVALLSLVLLLALRNGFRTPSECITHAHTHTHTHTHTYCMSYCSHIVVSQDAGTTGGTRRMEMDTVDLFSLAKVSHSSLVPCSMYTVRSRPSPPTIM